MNDILDQNKSENKRLRNQKLLNTLVFILIVLIILFAILKAWLDYQAMHTFFVSSYTVVNVSRGLLNFSVILTLGLAPSLYLRIKKNPKTSTLCLAAFFLGALLVKDLIHFDRLIF